MEVNSKLIEIHTGYVKDALEFVGMDHSNLLINVEITDGPIKDMQIVKWQVDGLAKPVAGSYQLGTDGDARLAVVMALGLIQHRYAVLIYDIILMAEQFLIPNEPERNNVLEISLRAAMASAIQQMPYSVVMQDVKQRYHFEKNLEAIHTAWVMRKELENVKDKVKGNGRKH